MSPCLFFFFFFFCLFVDFSEQFVLTGKCHATLSALTPALPTATTTTTHCLPLSLSFCSHFSSCSFPSPLFTSYHILFSLSLFLLCVSSPPSPWGSVVQSVPRNTMFNVLQRIYKWIKYKLPHMVTHIPQEEICKERRGKMCQTECCLLTFLRFFFFLAFLSPKSLAFYRPSLSSPSTFILSVSDEKDKKMCCSKAAGDKVTLVHVRPAMYDSGID